MATDPAPVADAGGAGSFAEAKAMTSKAASDLLAVASGKRAAATRDPNNNAFETSGPSKLYGPNAFDQAGGPRTT